MFHTLLGLLQILTWVPKHHVFMISGRYFEDIYRNTLKKHEGRAGNSRMATQTHPGDLLKIVHEGTGRWYYVWRGHTCPHNSVVMMLQCPSHPNMLPGSSIQDRGRIYADFGLTEAVAAECGAHAIRLTPVRLGPFKLPIFFPAWKTGLPYVYMFALLIGSCILLYWKK